MRHEEEAHRQHDLQLRSPLHFLLPLEQTQHLQNLEQEVELVLAKDVGYLFYDTYQHN